jgi:hypothetical protein
MSKLGKLTGFVLVTLAIVLSGIQYQLMSPRAYDLIATTVAMSGSDAIYDGAPASFFNWE